MTIPISRRQLLGAASAIAAAAALPTFADSALASDDPDMSLPPVPGMLGNRRANEFWYQFDLATLYAPAPGVIDAYLAINAYAADKGGVDAGPLVVWLETGAAPGYPRSFRDWAAPIRDPLALISQVQLTVFDRFYERRSDRLTKAFADFGQGVLYDPRHHDLVHTMDSPLSYPVWFAYARAMMVLDISAEHWREVLPLIAFACSLQLTAKPVETAVNPPLPAGVVRRIANETLHLGLRGLEAFFRRFPYPPGFPGTGTAPGVAATRLARAMTDS